MASGGRRPSSPVEADANGTGSWAGSHLMACQQCGVLASVCCSHSHPASNLLLDCDCAQEALNAPDREPAAGRGAKARGARRPSGKRNLLRSKHKHPSTNRVEFGAPAVTGGDGASEAAWGGGSHMHPGDRYVVGDAGPGGGRGACSTATTRPATGAKVAGTTSPQAGTSGVVVLLPSLCPCKSRVSSPASCTPGDCPDGY